MADSYSSRLGEWGTSVYYGAKVALPLLGKFLTGGPTSMAPFPRVQRPLVLDNPDLGTHHFAQLNDVKLHYVSKGDHQKPMMLCLHGYPEFWYSWRHQLKEFSTDYRVVAVDLRGYSESDKPSGVEAYTADKIIDDIQQFIKHLGYARCVLVAHDWGGALAYMFATKHKDLVEKMVVCNSAHPAALNKLMMTNEKQRKNSWYIFMYQWSFLPEVFMRHNDLESLDKMFRLGTKPGTFTDEDVEAFKYTFWKYEDISCPINWYRAARRYPSKDPAFRAKVNAPTLIIWGTGDEALSTESAELSTKYCKHSTIKYIEGGSHWIQQEEPEKVNEYMWDFLKGANTANIGSKL